MGPLIVLNRTWFAALARTVIITSDHHSAASRAAPGPQSRPNQRGHRSLRRCHRSPSRLL